MTKLSTEERKAVITRFYDQVAEGLPIDKEWIRGMVDASAPPLPEDATPAQLDAWIELAQMLGDPTFIENMRVMAQVSWTPEVDHAALRNAQRDAFLAVRDAMGRGIRPDSPEALAIGETFLASSAAASGQPLDAVYLRRISQTQDPRAQRYWELVAVMKGEPLSPQFYEGRWLGEAIQHAIARATSA